MQRKTLLGLATVALLAVGGFTGCTYSTAALATFGGLIVANRFSAFLCGGYPTRDNYEEKLA